MASWNLDWFGDTTHGPADDALQIDRVHAAIAGIDADIWGVVEVVGFEQWSDLKTQLNGYAGILSSDNGVTGGSRYYDDNEQKVGLLYKTTVATLEDARLILTDYDVDFAGRPPLQGRLRVTLNAATEDVTFIVIHPKCCTDLASWQHRVNASTALKTYLDTTFPTQKVWVIGDFNDDIDASTATGQPSPYFNFVSDPVRYGLPTQALSEANIASTVEYPETIDHHLITNEVIARYVPGSATVLRLDQAIDDYGSTTSDHYPVLSRYYWGDTGGYVTGAGDAQAISGATDAGIPSDGPIVFINEICANEPGKDTAAEFIELVNAGASPMDITAWTISDSTTIRHTFGPDTSVAPGKAVVVFAGADAIPAGLSNALAASTGRLDLANSGDSVILEDANGIVVENVIYTAALAEHDGTSMNRSPDAIARAPFAAHTALSTLAASPGKRANGSDW